VTRRTTLDTTVQLIRLVLASKDGSDVIGYNVCSGQQPISKGAWGTVSCEGQKKVVNKPMC
jgi:hypothetical protein